MIALSEQGIYIFEMINCKGKIYGKSEDTTWRRVRFKKVRNDFSNPVKKAQGHKLSLSQYLNIEQDKIFIVCVFSNKCKLNNLNLTGEEIVMNLKDVQQMLYFNYNRIRPVFTHKELNDIVSKIDKN